MTDIQVDWPHTWQVVADAAEKQLHHAIQLCVAHRGQIVLDAVISPGDPPFGADDLMLWRSAGKPLTAAAVLRLSDRGLLSPDDLLAERIAEAAFLPVGQLTLQHLLTHTSGRALVNTGWPKADWGQVVEAVLHAEPTEPVGQAAYHPQSSWFLLGEILRRSAGAARFDEVLQREILQPLEMPSGCYRLDAEVAPVTLYERVGGRLSESPYSRGEHVQAASPGGSFRGTARDMVRFLECLRNDGRAPDGRQLLQPETVGRMTQRHRAGQFDTTLQHVVDFGWGVIINSNRYGVETVPYGYGRYASEAAFGHGGSQCSIAFTDPAHELSVAWAADAFCGEGQHQRRNRAINAAIYEDLGLNA